MKGIRIIPHSTLSNDKISALAKVLHRPNMYVNRYNLKLMEKVREKKFKIKDLVKKENYKHCEDTDLVCFQENFIYEIEITRNDIEFRILHKDIEHIMEDYKRYIHRINFDKEIKDYKLNLKGCSVVEMRLSEHFMFGLKTSYTGLEPLRYILDFKRQLKEGEKLIYQVILHSLNEEWQSECAKALLEFNSGHYPSKANLSAKKVLRGLGNVGAKVALEGVYILQEIILGEKNVTKIDLTEDSVQKMKRGGMVSLETRKKSTEVGFEVGIRGLIYCEDGNRRDELKRSFKGCFMCMDGNNKLEGAEIKLKKDDLNRVRNRELLWKPLSSNKTILNSNEVGKLLLLPQATLQKEYGMKRTDFANVSLPKEAFEGKIPVGHIYGGIDKRMITWGGYREALCLSKIIVGIKGSGKSKYLENYVYGAYQMGHSTFYFDYIENCVNALEVSKHIPKKDVKIIDLSKGFTMNFPEITNTHFDISDREELRQYKACASDYASLIEDFIDTINLGNTEPLTGDMRNILNSASVLCFYAQKLELYDVFKFLTDGRFTKEVLDINRKRGILREDDFRYSQIISICKFDTEENIIGIKGVDRVLARFNALLRDSRTAEMLEGIEENEFDFVEMMEENKFFAFLLPESYFRSYTLKDIVMTYFLARLRLSAIARSVKIPNRDSRKIVNIVMDEIHQLKNATDIMVKNVAEDRKYRTCYVYTCQYLLQFGKLLQAVVGSGCNIMFLTGTVKANFLAFKEEIGTEFSIEELINMPPRHSFNIIKYDGQVSSCFLSKLPNVLEKRLKNK